MKGDISAVLKTHHEHSGYMPQIVPELQVKARGQHELVLDEMLNVSKVLVKFVTELDRGGNLILSFLELRKK